MAPKKIDYDNDGIVTEKEIDLEIKAEKAEAQMKIAASALAALIVVTVYLVSPWGPDVTKITALSDALSMFYVATASVCGAYMGFSAWMSKK